MATLIEAFEKITPLVREHAQSAEQAGRLAKPVVDAMVEAGVARLFLAQPLGGLEVDPLTCARVTETLARADSAAGWFVMVANAARLMASTWPEGLVEQLFAQTPDTLIAASGNKPLQGEKTAAGYLLNGTNGFVSGCHHAEWFMTPFSAGNARFMALLPMADCEILETWTAWGMRGTGSNDVKVTNQTVPFERVVSIDEPAGKNRYHSGTLYRCPGRVLFATYVPITLVLAEQALAALAELAQTKTPAGVAAKLRDRSIAQIKYGRGLATFRSAKLYFHDALAVAYDRAGQGQDASPEQKADLYLAGTHAVQASAEVVRLVADAAGTSVIFEDQPLARIVRDMEMLRHHGFANESRYGSVTQQLWGAGLDYPLLLR